MSMSELARLWFVSIPRHCAKYSRALAYLLADGHFLMSRVAVAAIATPVCFALGLLAGASSIGYDRVFTESLLLMVVAAAIGFLATGLGVAFVVGFAFGDFFIGDRTWSASLYTAGPLSDGFVGYLLRARLPMLIGYLLLLGLVVYIPRLARALVADIPQATKLPKNFAFAIASILNVVVVAVAVRLWAEATAVLIRPLWTWQGLSPTTEAIIPLQQQAKWIVLAAVAGTIARFAHLWFAYSSREGASRIVEAEKALAAALPQERKGPLVPPAVTALIAAVVSAASLSGLFSGWKMALIGFGVFAVLHLIRQGVLPPSLEWWKRIVVRVPILVRIGIGLMIANTLRDGFASEYDMNFDRLSVFMLASIVMLFVLLPGPPKSHGSTEKVS